jgi:hypothetical protein
MWIFGGKNDEDMKLNDMWRLDLATLSWDEIVVKGNSPLVRSGNSLQTYENYLVLFGGIHDMTRELNDCHLFDIAKKKWISLYDETNSPVKIPANSPVKMPAANHYSNMSVDEIKP